MPIHSSDVTGVTVRQAKGEEVRFLFNPADHDQGFAEIGLRMTRWM